MRIIDNIVYYTSLDCASVCNRSLQQFTNWDKYSNQLEAEGKARLIPRPALILNKRRLYTKDQLNQILVFSRNIKHGQMAEYSRTRCGQRGRDIDERMQKKAQKKIFKELKENLDKVNKAVDYKERFKHLKNKRK